MKSQVFNNKSRATNIFLSSSVGTVCDILRVAFGFVYRTVFLHFLSEDYLGLDGLFSNILAILSLAELGIGTSITYRFYEPINNNDVQEVGRLMNFFKKVYNAIACFILVAGIAVMPFLPRLMNSRSEIPDGVNLYVIYLLFLINTLSSYLFSYRLTILNADQRTYLFNIISTIMSLVMYIAQIMVLAFTRNYTLTIAAGILCTLIVNIVSSRLVTHMYEPVFRVREIIDKKEQHQIFDDTKALMYHKVGTTVLTSTDSLILTKMVGLAATGLYSNYSLIILNLENVFSKIFGNFVSSIGNARLNLKKDDYYRSYRQMNFLDLFFSSIATVCLYSCIDDFISVWLGPKFVFQRMTTSVLCTEFFLQTTSVITGVYTNASGLFVKDRLRPIIESVLNLVVSILLTFRFGIFGVFAGTVVSNLCTVFWRCPYVLYKNDFSERSQKDYWGVYFKFMESTILLCLFRDWLAGKIHITPCWGFLFLEFFVMAILSFGLLYLLNLKNEEMSLLKNMLRSLVKDHHLSLQ